MRSKDFGTASTKTYIVNSHLGEIINFNDTVLAYDLEQINLNEIEELEDSGRVVPDLVVVKKCYPKLRKR
jgi:hypothetical protein